jgi:hypothetical protein
VNDNEEFVRYWKEIRNKGKFNCIITNAFKDFLITLLLVIVISCVAVAAVTSYTGSNFFDVLTTQVIMHTLINISVAIPITIIFNYFTWNSNEKKYKKIIDSQIIKISHFHKE